MLNTFAIIGRFYNYYDSNNEESQAIMSMQITDETNDTVTVPIILSKDIASKSKEYLEEGDIVAVKGFISVDNNGTVLVATKISFLASKSKKGN